MKGKIAWKILGIFCLFTAMQAVQICIFRPHINTHSPTIRNQNNVTEVERDELPGCICN